MSKINGKLLLVNMILLIALLGMTFLYVNMKNTAKENLNQVLEIAEENSKLNARIHELEEKKNISTITNRTMPNSNVTEVNRTVPQNEISEEREVSIDLDKVTIEVDENTITPKSVSIIITNNNENEIMYGEEYKIQKNVNGQWENLEYLPDTVWNAIGYITKGKEQTTKKINFEATYGELSEGTYRVVKSILNGGDGTIYSNEFEIKSY